MPKTPKKAQRICELLALLLLAPVFAGAQVKPKVTVSPTHVKAGDPVYMSGSGGTPNRTVLSHLLRPNGTEYNPLRFTTDQQGEFVHKIDTTMLSEGTFEVWFEDEPSKVLSNHAQFVVE